MADFGTRGSSVGTVILRRRTSFLQGTRIPGMTRAVTRAVARESCIAAAIDAVPTVKPTATPNVTPERAIAISDMDSFYL
jgi:hypothetical protein